MTKLTNIILSSEATGDTGSGGPGNIIIYVIIGLIVVAAVVMLIMSNVSRRKQQKESEKQKSSLQPGDTVETGGTEFVIETGEPDRATTLTVDMQALYRILSQSGAPVVEDKKAAVSKPDVEGIASSADKEADVFSGKKSGKNGK